MTEILPSFSKDLEGALRKDGDVDLADQISELRIWNLCGCDDDFCSSFYTGPAPSGAWSDEGEFENVTPPTEGMVILDVVDRRIRYVEVISDPEVKTALSHVPGLSDSDN